MQIIYVCQWRASKEGNENWQFGCLFSTEAIAKKRFAEMNKLPEVAWGKRDDLTGYDKSGYWYGERVSTNPYLPGHVEAFRILPTIVDLYAEVANA